MLRENYKEFQEMYTDLHNIVPAIGEVNQARNDFRFGELYSDNRDHVYSCHGCKIIIDRHYRVVEPRDEMKGLIARAHLYIANTYEFKLSENQNEMFNRWNNAYPPSRWEIEWNNRVKAIQGRDNVFISNYFGKI